MIHNPFPVHIIDEASGVQVSNPDYVIWDEGYVAGIKNFMELTLGLAGRISAHMTQVVEDSVLNRQVKP